MGLAERRRVAKIRDEHQPRFQSELDAAIGFSVPFEIDVASFPEDATILDCYDYYYESYGPGLVVKVMAGVCVDDMGKEAVQSSIQKIIFRNAAKSADEPGEMSVVLPEGVLSITESFYGYSDKLYGEDNLKATIENLL